MGGQGRRVSFEDLLTSKNVQYPATILTLTVKNKKTHKKKRKKQTPKKKTGGSHCCQVVVLVSSWNPGSESLERIMSLGEPKIRLHSTICRSSGSRDMILKNL